MAKRLEEKLRENFDSSAFIDKTKSLMVGDSAYVMAKKGKPAELRPDGRPGFNLSNSDRLFAVNEGVAFYEPQDFFGWKQFGVESLDTQEQLAELLHRMGNRGACDEALGF